MIWRLPQQGGNDEEAFYGRGNFIGILKKAEARIKVAEVCRTYGISEATYYN
jgi:hypothetical protein